MGITNQAFVAEGVKEFEGRIKKYVSYERIELPVVKISPETSPFELKKKEAIILLKQISDGDYLVLLDENGKIYNSVEFASQLQKMMNRGVKNICFMIGGAYGFDQSVYDRADSKIALSAMTFSHQLVRVIFAEQLYRGLSILKGEKYHH